MSIITSAIFAALLVERFENSSAGPGDGAHRPFSCVLRHSLRQMEEIHAGRIDGPSELRGLDRAFRHSITSGQKLRQMAGLRVRDLFCRAKLASHLANP